MSIKTWVYVAVAHGVDNVLAFSIALVEELLSQTVSFREWAGVKRVAEVHHLVDGEQGLVASLLPFSQFLLEKISKFTLVKRSPSNREHHMVFLRADTLTMSTSISNSVSRFRTSLLSTTNSAFCTENFLFGSGAAIMEPWPAPKSPLQAISTYRVTLKSEDKNKTFKRNRSNINAWIYSTDLWGSSSFKHSDKM